MIKLVKQIDICTSKFQGFNLREGKKKGGVLFTEVKKKKAIIFLSAMKFTVNFLWPSWKY